MSFDLAALLFYLLLLLGLDVRIQLLAVTAVLEVPKCIIGPWANPAIRIKNLISSL